MIGIKEYDKQRFIDKDNIQVQKELKNGKDCKVTYPVLKRKLFRD